jgi:hypothetical protein
LDAAVIAYTSRQAPMDTIPVSMAPLVGPDAGGPAGLVGDDMAQGHGAAIDADLADLKARVAALEGGDAA